VVKCNHGASRRGEKSFALGGEYSRCQMFALAGE
jgi:hypothetical protein